MGVRSPAFDFVCQELRALARSIGSAKAAIARDVLVERGLGTAGTREQIEAAVTVLALSQHLVLEKDGGVRFAPGAESYPLASEQVKQMASTRAGQSIRKKDMRARVHPVVRDVIARRTDGRPKSAEPLDAFADALESLGYAPFRLWWVQTVAELRRLDISLSPVSIAVLSAALVEGALTFVVKHARSSRLGVFQSKDFDRDPHTWKVDDLVASASTGRDTAILDVASRHRADALIKVRQRIHAGRMLTDHPSGVPDLRPEEARDARATADLVIRRILDWLQRFPVGSSPSGG